MSIICSPSFQFLGFEGETALLKVSYEIIDDKKNIKGYYGAVLRFRAQDFPRYSPGAEFIHTNLNRLELGDIIHKVDDNE